MIARCTNPDDPGYVRYGARGIKVCDRWLSWPNFLEDVGPTYVTGLTIERKDNEGAYEPGNFRWATRREQQANTRKVVLITKDGETHPAREWARRLGVHHSRILDEHRGINRRPRSSADRAPASGAGNTGSIPVEGTWNVGRKRVCGGCGARPCLHACPRKNSGRRSGQGGSTS